ncbi:uncharacterized protein LOC124287633 [Haliotis rubra]|uniref:uncharacterized protein LOC124287633 n=1 Tax=Haliotis rubra TaxID=36100 RepID=UPI001EE6130A|nr:uncharacterized protein LOC124287633 [Haliotis rubra]
MRSAIAVIFLCLCLNSVASGHGVETKQSCTSNASITFNLTCSERDMLHFIDLNIRNMTANCGQGSCKSGFASSKDVDCMGVSSCQKTVNKTMIERVCGTVEKYQPTISYECVDETPVDICSTAGAVSDDEMTLFLASPNYPGNSNASDTNRTCTCDLAGSGMSVEILVGYYGWGDGKMDKFNLTSGSETYTPTIANSTIGHLIIGPKPMENKNEITLNYNAIQKEGRDGDYLWLRVKGTSYLTVACNGAAPPSTPEPGLTTQATEGASQLGGIPMLTVASICAAVGFAI